MPVVVALLRSIWASVRRGSLDDLRTAFSITPRYGRDVRSGIAIYQPEDAARVVGAVVERGFGVASHALGNAAIEVALGAYAAAGRHLSRGVAAVVQPSMLEMHMAASAARIPGLPFFPLRRLLDADVALVGSSDYPVHSFDPLVGIRAAVSRRNARGVVVDPEERITLDEAITMYTRRAAEVLGVGAETGTLTAGKRADVVVVEGLEDAAPRVVQTFVGGAPV